MRFSAMLYITLPLLISSFLAFFIFDIPEIFLPGIYFLIGLSLCVIPLEILRYKNNVFPKIGRAQLLSQLNNNVLAILFGLGIALFCLIDLAAHGLVLFNPDPSAYATFTPLQAHIRHISLMCWTLAPIAILVINNRYLKLTFLLIAFGFPILVMDRNRLLASLVATAMTYFLFPELNKISWSGWVKIVCITLIGVFLFGALGNKRLGKQDVSRVYLLSRSQQNRMLTLKNTECDIPNKLPVSEFFQQTPNKLQWSLIYMTSPIFNFGTINYCQYRDADYLAAQLIPFYGKVNQLKPPPLVSPVLNVGTEFLPFLLLGGFSSVAAAFLAAYGLFVFATMWFTRSKDIFSFLLFLRVSYCAIMLNFASQMFTWTNFGFIFLCLGLGWLAKQPLVTAFTNGVIREPNEPNYQ